MVCRADPTEANLCRDHHLDIIKRIITFHVQQRHTDIIFIVCYEHVFLTCNQITIPLPYDSKTRFDDLMIHSASPLRHFGISDAVNSIEQIPNMKKTNG